MADYNNIMQHLYPTYDTHVHEGRNGFVAICVNEALRISQQITSK